MPGPTTCIILFALRTLKIISDMSLATESRAFDAYAESTFVDEPHYARMDSALLAAMGVVMVSAIILRARGFGGVIPGLLWLSRRFPRPRRFSRTSEVYAVLAPSLNHDTI